MDSMRKTKMIFGGHLGVPRKEGHSHVYGGGDLIWVLLFFWAGFLWVAVEIPAKTGSTPHFKKDAHAVDDHENECITGSGVRTSL